MSRESQGLEMLLSDIEEGELDNCLDEVALAIRYRKEKLARDQARALADLIGEESLVKIRDDAPVRPHYLRGLLLEVEKVNRKTVSCKVANPELLPSRRYRGGIRVPMEHLELELA